MMDKRVDKIIEILRYIVAIDDGIRPKHAEYIEEMLDELECDNNAE